MTRWESTEPFELDGLWLRLVPEEQATSRKRKGNDHLVLQFYAGAREELRRLVMTKNRG